MTELVLHYWIGWVPVCSTCHTEWSKLRDMVIEVSKFEYSKHIVDQVCYTGDMTHYFLWRK